MDLQGLAGTYDAVFSIGYNGQPSIQRIKNRLYANPGPLDWMLSDLPDVGRLLENRFEGFMDRNRLRIIGKDQNELFHLVQDSLYRVISAQDFSIHHDPDGQLPDYPAFARRLHTRAQHFLYELERSRMSLFIRTGATWEQTVHFVKLLDERLTYDYRLLVVNYGGSNGITDCFWPLERVCGIRLPVVSGWTSQDALWKILLAGVNIVGEENNR
ncbi:DUF1796 family putative cysteine peptidase [Gorillibacterium timonense]|uniref:DUF1796 family putative cysteine peptidase n=1 Tax=Gorillibacterium timonense TaxID=1689269 RepID=UPI00071CA7D9|nr:DUF1796 family putative cysteine peptidase [Gorillibacterium timonense]